MATARGGDADLLGGSDGGEKKRKKGKQAVKVELLLIFSAAKVPKITLPDRQEKKKKGKTGDKAARGAAASFPLAARRTKGRG